MRLEWTRPALSDFADSQEYLNEESSQLAELVAGRVLSAAHQLKDHPRMGRPGHNGSREWVVKRTPYILVYQVNGDLIEILRMWHDKQDWRE